MNTKPAFFTGKAHWVVLLGLVVITVALNSARTPPPENSASTPAQEFSGERAFGILSELLSENLPHPVGSAENEVVRDRIVSLLGGLGLSSEIQSDFKCSTLAPGCSSVENIIAIKHGSGDGEKAILLTSHYDSVPGAPGAADAGSGVAAMLEIAANLNNGPLMRNDVVLLFTDAEETGLRGAMAFADSHPLMDKVGMVLNMEARGISGPSVMFETGPNNLNQVAGFIQATDNPVASSLIVEMYKRMPNGTDYTVYRMKDIPGLNYAFTQGVSLYHSALDDLDHLDRGSLQHHGSNLLSAVRHFGNSDLTELGSSQDATYIDVFGQAMIWWPASWGPLIACIAIILMLGVIIKARKARPVTTLWAILAVMLSLVVILFLGWLASFPLGQLGRIHPLEHPYPWPARVALIAIALGVGAWSGTVFIKRTNVESLFYVVWVPFSIIGLLLALTVTGASYIFVIPSFAASLTAAFALIRSRQHALLWGAYAGLAVAGYMALYHFLLLEAVFNFHMSHFKMIPLWLLALALMPVAATWKNDPLQKTGPFYLIIGVITVLGLIAGSVVTLYTEERPRSVNIVYSQKAEDTAAQWQIETFGPADIDYLKAAAFPETPVSYTRNGRVYAEGHFIPAPNLGFEPPVLNLLKDETRAGQRFLTGTVASPRGGFTLGLSIADAAPIQTISIEGQVVLEANEEKLSGSRLIRLHGLRDQAVRFEITAQANQPIEIQLYDLDGLPDHPDSQKLKSLRPDNAAPIHYGDYSIVSRLLVF